MEHRSRTNVAPFPLVCPAFAVTFPHIFRQVTKSMTNPPLITQICVVVRDVRQVNANWAKVLGRPEAEVVTIFPPGILHFTHGQAAEYSDCQVAKYDLGSIILELIQPGESASPWRAFLEKHGQGVFHMCALVADRKGFQQTLAEIGVGLPYHIGYFPQGSYSYVASAEQLGLELSVNTLTNDAALFQHLLDGTAQPLDEIR